MWTEGKERGGLDSGFFMMKFCLFFCFLKYNFFFLVFLSFTLGSQVLAMVLMPKNIIIDGEKFIFFNV